MPSGLLPMAAIVAPNPARINLYRQVNVLPEDTAKTKNKKNTCVVQNWTRKLKSKSNIENLTGRRKVTRPASRPAYISTLSNETRDK